MVKIQVDLSKDEDKIVEIFKLVYGLKTKQEAIRLMVKHFNIDITPKHLKKNEEYYKKAKKFIKDEN